MKNASRASTKRRRDSKLNKPRKKQEQTTASAQAFSVKDTPYHPSSSVSRYTADSVPKTEPVLKPKPSVRKVPRSAENNRRDPFYVLNDEVRLIISLLPARDTETLRRVSKLWKASSEFHCGKSALLKHFPWAASKVDEFGSREEANLLFRRYLYHQGSLLVGNATRALKCTDVINWHIGNNSLVWLRAPAPGRVQIVMCALKSDDGVSTKPFDIVELDAKGLGELENCMKYVQITPDGELLVHLTSLKRRCSDEVVEKLVKMTQGKVFTWQIKLKAQISRSVIGKSAIYFVQHRQKLQSAPIEAVFCKASLKDGSVIYEIPLLERYGIEIGVFYRNTSLTLTPDENCAAWNDLLGKVHIFSTASGQVIHTFPLSYNASVVAVSSVDNTIRVIHNGWGHSRSHLTAISFIKETDTFGAERFDLPMKPIGHSWFWDGDRRIFCYLLHEAIMQADDIPWPPNQVDCTTLDPFTTIGIRPRELSLPAYISDDLHNRAASFMPEGMRSVATVTLPPRSMGEDKRRDLKVELPLSPQYGDFFGMYEDYLVYDSRFDHSLTLVDFWPTW